MARSCINLFSNCAYCTAATPCTVRGLGELASQQVVESHKDAGEVMMPHRTRLGSSRVSTNAVMCTWLCVTKMAVMPKQSVMLHSPLLASSRVSNWGRNRFVQQYVVLSLVTWSCVTKMAVMPIRSMMSRRPCRSDRRTCGSSAPNGSSSSSSLRQQECRHRIYKP